MTTTTTTTKQLHSYSINDCQIDGVTIFQDRAEVTRSMIFTPNQTGEHEITVNLLTINADPESFRVRGNGFCEILEVAHDIRTDKIEISQSNVKDLLNQIEELEKVEKSITQATARLHSQRRLTQSYADNIMGKGKSKDETTLTLNEAKEVLSYYMDEMLRLDQLEVEQEEKLTTLTETLTLLRNDLKLLRQNHSKDTLERTRSVIVLINVTEIKEMNLTLTYVVSNATWSPSYDIRLNTTQNLLDLSYFAEVTQSSGENWIDCNVCLSTSNPAIGSSPPPLPTKTIDWDYNCHVNYNNRGRKMNSNSHYENHNTKSKSKRYSEREYSDDGRYEARQGSFALMDERGGDGVGGGGYGGLPGQPGGLGTGTSTDLAVNGNDAGSTTFIIPRKVTIDSDNKPHKVTVTIASFIPQMVHYVAASISAFVYLQSKTQNTSPYPLLPSDKVSVFLDGNFVATTSIKQTSPGEHFNVFLGVDPSVKVQYMPCKAVQYVKGWLSGTEVKKYFYSTIIHNTKQRPIRVIVAEVLPRASDEKIVIELLEPLPTSLTKASSETAPILNEQDVIAGLDGFDANAATGGGGGEPTRSTPTWPRDFVTQNKFTNNIVWLKTIQPGEKTEIKFSYRVAWPQGQSVGMR